MMPARSRVMRREMLRRGSASRKYAVVGCSLRDCAVALVADAVDGRLFWVDSNRDEALQNDEGGVVLGNGMSSTVGRDYGGRVGFLLETTPLRMAESRAARRERCGARQQRWRAEPVGLRARMRLNVCAPQQQYIARSQHHKIVGSQAGRRPATTVRPLGKLACTSTGEPRQ